MKHPTLQMTGPVPVAEIETGSRIRPVSEAGVAAIIASIRDVGVMKDPVHLRRKKGGVLVLIAGAHRLEAARRLGWETVEARVWVDVTDDWARLMEIDDNLAGAELNPLDTAVFLARRKEVYERLHPEAKANIGAQLAAKRWDAADTMSVASFAAVTAEKFGMSERNIRRLIAAGAALAPPDLAHLRQAARPVTLKDLTELARCDAPTRYEAVLRFATGKAKTIAEARRSLKPGAAPAVKDPVEDQFKALSSAWERAGAPARKRFLLEYRQEVWEAQNKGAPLAGRAKPGNVSSHDDEGQAA
jgi:ParB family chromosome partitioning protein